MGKIEKKRARILERIQITKDEMSEALTKKESSTKEISLVEYQKRLRVLELELKNLK